MARKGRQGERGPQTNWETERTLADVEQEQADSEFLDDSGLVCACGSDEFLLEAYLHVVKGVPRPEPVEVETLTCPSCSREFEAIQGEGGKILRGDFVGYADLDDED
ncbi:hypothetical protein [Vulgatibacter sp.]|uniref:hypothetical protein n=1 Tax=Vulgatibacter sp. TaxID=1971226 RepID=UPI0035645494